MAIDNFIFACSIDDSPGYFTYENNSMLIIKSKKNSKFNIDDFKHIEPFIESLISHESIHIIIKKIESSKISDSLDDLEIVVEREGTKFQVTLNNMLFARDMSGIVVPDAIFDGSI